MLKLEDVGKWRPHSPPRGLWLLCTIHPQSCTECTGKVLPGERKNLDWSGYGLLDLDEFQVLPRIGSENSPDIAQFNFSALLEDMEARLLYIFHSGQLWSHPRWCTSVMSLLWGSVLYSYHIYAISLIGLSFLMYLFFGLLFFFWFGFGLFFSPPSYLSLTCKCFNVERVIL